MNFALLRRLTIALAALTMAAIAVPITAYGADVAEQTPWGGVSQVDNLAMATTLFEVVLNSDDPNTPEALVAADAVIHTAYGDFTGPAGLSDYLEIIRNAYPDAWFDVRSIAVQGDSIVVDWVMTASRYQIDPVEPLLIVNVEMPGTTTITVAEGQIAGLDQTQVVVASSGSSAT
jgi:hypothetical protein